jgi:hypothetical protein
LDPVDEPFDLLTGGAVSCEERAVDGEVPLAGEGDGGGVEEDRISELRVSSVESRIAESMMRFVTCCRNGDTSDGFHCSSSTSLADIDIRV